MHGRLVYCALLYSSSGLEYSESSPSAFCATYVATALYCTELHYSTAGLQLCATLYCMCWRVQSVSEG